VPTPARRPRSAFLEFRHRFEEMFTARFVPVKVSRP
jgi:hypothetical protein